MEAIILFSAIADHEEKIVSYKNSLHVFANNRNENSPIVGKSLKGQKLMCNISIVNRSGVIRIKKYRKRIADVMLKRKLEGKEQC